MGPDVLIIGGTGLLGRHVAALAASLGLSGHATFHRTPPPTSIDWHRVDLRDGGEGVAALIIGLRPRAVINVAYTPGEPDLTAVTADAPGAIAEATATTGSRLVHLSSDVVFDGTSAGAYAESDRPAPINAYGRAKLRAETLVAHRDPSAVIVRTSLIWANSPDGGPQVRLVNDPDIRFFTDEVRNPIRVDRLAAACLELTARPEISGLLHVAGEDAVDRLTFARALAPLVDRAPGDLRGSLGDPEAARPRRVVLDSGLARSLLDTPLPGIHTDAPHRLS